MRNRLRKIGNWKWKWEFWVTLSVVFTTWFIYRGITKDPVYFAFAGLWQLNGVLTYRNPKWRREREHRKAGTNHPGGATAGAIGHAYTGTTSSTTRAIAAAAGRGISYASGGPVAASGTTIRGTYSGMNVSNRPVTFSRMASLVFDDVDPDTIAIEPNPVVFPVHGYRSWRLRPDDVMAVLWPLNAGQTAHDWQHSWMPGKNEAVCNREDYQYISDDDETHIAASCENPPSPTCGCGFWAFNDVLTIANGDVIGGVVGWGKVFVASNGWRSQYASVAAILCPNFVPGDYRQRLEFISELYNIPLVPTARELRAKTVAFAKWMGGEDLLEATET